MKSLEDVFNAASLCNFADKKTGDPVIVYASDVENMRKKYNSYRCNWPCLGRGNLSACRLLDSLSYEIKNYRLVGELISLFPNKLVLAGGSIRSMMLGHRPSDYDIFFYNTIPAEAENIILACVKYTKKRSEFVKFEKSQNVTNIIIDDGVKIQFIHRIYKTRGQILLGFDLTGARIGWAHDCGLFFTIDSAVAIACHGFPLDLTQLSTSFGARLLKYIDCKRFNIYIPNINLSSGEVTTMDLILKKSTSFISVGRKNRHGQLYDYESNQEDKKFCNWWFIAKGCGEFVMFESNDIEKLTNIGNDVIESSIFCGNIWNNKFDNGQNIMTKFKVMKQFLGDDFFRFVNAAVSDDGKLATKIWQERRQYYMDSAIDIAKKVSSLDKWRTKDPGSQSFGKYNPVNVSPREWCGESNYIPYVVGLTHDRVITFRLCCGRLCENMPDDIDYLLINYWFWAEVNDARNELLCDVNLNQEKK